MSPERAGTIALLATTIVWGSTFLFMREASIAFRDAAGPGGEYLGAMVCLATRFALAFAAGCLLFRMGPRAFTRGDWVKGGAMAAPMVAGFVLQTYALERTTPAVCAFLTSLYVVFTPILDYAVRRRLPKGRVVAGIWFAVAGTYLLTGPGTGGAGPGEILSVVSAAIFAGHILLIDALTRGGRELELTMTTIGVAAVLFSAPIPFLGGVGRLAQADFWRTALADPWVSAGVPYLALVATIVGLGIVNRFQKALDPTRAAVIYTIEPIWAFAISAAAGREVASAGILTGMGLILAGNLWSEVGFPRPRRPTGGSTPGLGPGSTGAGSSAGSPGTP